MPLSQNEIDTIRRFFQTTQPVNNHLNSSVSSSSSIEFDKSFEEILLAHRKVPSAVNMSNDETLETSTIDAANDSAYYDEIDPQYFVRNEEDDAMDRLLEEFNVKAKLDDVTKLSTIHEGQSSNVSAASKEYNFTNLTKDSLNISSVDSERNLTTDSLDESLRFTKSPEMSEASALGTHSIENENLNAEFESVPSLPDLVEIAVLNESQQIATPIKKRILNDFKTPTKMQTPKNAKTPISARLETVATVVNTPIKTPVESSNNKYTLHNVKTPTSFKTPIKANAPINPRTPINAKTPISAETPLNVKTPNNAKTPIKVNTPINTAMMANIKNVSKALINSENAAHTKSPVYQFNTFTPGAIPKFRNNFSRTPGHEKSASVESQKNHRRPSDESLNIIPNINKTSFYASPRSSADQFMQSIADDTLEELEYVKETNDKYVLKPVKNRLDLERLNLSTKADSKASEIEHPTESPIEIQIASTMQSEKNDSPNKSHNLSVISLDSSPEISYKTAQTHQDSNIFNKSAKDSAAQLNQNENSIKYNRKSNESVSLKTSTSFATAAYSNASDIIPEIEIIELSDDEYDDEEHYAKSESSQQLHNSNLISHQNTEMIHTLDEVSSILTDTKSNASVSKSKTSISTIDSDELNEKENFDGVDFNDTLERVEYMIEEGKKLKLLEANEQLLTPKAKTLEKPASATKAYEITPLTRMYQKKTPKTDKSPLLGVAGVLKPRNEKSPMSASASKLFKKPDILPLKKMAPSSTSKIPKLKGAVSASKKHQFDHIISPIGVYIKNIAPSPLAQEIRPTKDFLDSTLCRNTARELDFNMSNASSNESIVTASYCSSLPKKAYISSDLCYIIDERNTKIPGGEKINRIIGPEPIVIRNEGKVKLATQKHGTPAPLINDSVADLSLMVGDVSLQVVRDVQRN